MSNKVDIWEWEHRDRAKFREEGGAKKAIIDHYEEFWRCYHDDPIGAELAIHQAIEAAKEVGDPRWELHLRHWRIQNWVGQSQVKRMLPEAIDLLSLAVDERVKDIPQRICAYHDVVECYVEMDPAGYYQEIKENAEHILSQLPKCYPCADCARSNLARAAAAAGKVEEAEHWLAEHEANRHDDPQPNNLHGRGLSYLSLGQWENAERTFLEGSKLARKRQEGNSYLSSLLGIARARIGKKDVPGLQNILPSIRYAAKYDGGSHLAARTLEVEGYMAELLDVPQAALEYFRQSAKIRLELGCYREAAEVALHAAELAREKGIAEEEALEIAALVVGMLPPASEDLYQRLAALGKKPAAAQEQQSEDRLTAEQLKETEERKELASLEALLQAHMQSGNLPGITVALFRLAIWYEAHRQNRAAVDYFIWSAALERLGKFSQRERADALGGLKHMGKKLPAGAVEGALRAAESAPPSQLLPLLSDVPAAQWQWTIQAIATEVTDKPVVEPAPEDKDRAARFQEWVGHCASMTALIIRFRAKADPAKCEAWANTLDSNFQEMMAQAEAHKDEPGAMVVPSFVQGLAALSRGAELAEVKQQVLAPLNQVIEQIGQISTQPVWRHPESTPLDFLVEQAAQKAVRALRHHDGPRASRLANLAFRYELMTIDLREHKELEGMARFLDALVALVQNDGKALPTSEPPLEEPYEAILTAVFQAGQEHTVSHDDEEE